MSAIGQRGKDAEKAVQKHLEKLNRERLTFAFERLPDARAARGYLKAQVSDFLCWYARRSFPLEIKETQHDFRLPKDKLEQLPRLRKIALAGSPGLVVVFHSTLNRWRCAHLSFFDGEIPPSWDLRPLDLYNDVEDALASSGYFP